jgi:hypothetical protein
MYQNMILCNVVSVLLIRYVYILFVFAEYEYKAIDVCKSAKNTLGKHVFSILKCNFSIVPTHHNSTITLALC